MLTLAGEQHAYKTNILVLFKDWRYNDEKYTKGYFCVHHFKHY